MHSIVFKGINRISNRRSLISTSQSISTNVGSGFSISNNNNHLHLIQNQQTTMMMMKINKANQSSLKRMSMKISPLSFSTEKKIDNKNKNNKKDEGELDDQKFMEENMQQMQNLFKQVSSELKRRQEIQDERDRVQDEKDIKALEKENEVVDSDDIDPNDPKQREKKIKQESQEEEQDVLGGSKLEDDFNFEELFKNMRTNPDKSVLETQTDFSKDELDHYFELFEKNPEELVNQMNALNNEEKEKIVLDYINEKLDLSKIAEDYLPEDLGKIKNLAKNLNNLSHEQEQEELSKMEEIINRELNRAQGLPLDSKNQTPVDLEEIGEITDMTPEQMEEQMKEIERKFAAMDAELEREDEYLSKEEKEMIEDESLSDPELEKDLQKFMEAKYPAKKTKKLSEFRIKEDVRAKKAVEQEKSKSTKLPTNNNNSEKK